VDPRIGESAVDDAPSAVRVCPEHRWLRHGAHL